MTSHPPLSLRLAVPPSPPLEHVFRAMDLVARYVLFGTPTRIAEQLDALRLGGLQHANLSFGPLKDDASAQAACAVVEAVRRQGRIDR